MSSLDHIANNASTTSGSSTAGNVQNERIPVITPSKDDWSGLSDAAERRKRQNRVNKRASRKSYVASGSTYGVVVRFRLTISFLYVG